MDARSDKFKIVVQENDELKAKIQKKRCCDNCKHSKYSELFHGVVCLKSPCRNFDKWELSE